MLRSSRGPLVGFLKLPPCSAKCSCRPLTNLMLSGLLASLRPQRRDEQELNQVVERQAEEAVNVAAHEEAGAEAER